MEGYIHLYFKQRLPLHISDIEKTLAIQEILDRIYIRLIATVLKSNIF